MKSLCLPPWPKGIPRVFKPIAKIEHDERIKSYDLLDMFALNTAKRIQAQNESVQCSALTGTWTKLIFSNRADFNAVASTASEATLLGGSLEQPTIPALFFDGNKAFGKCISLLARGVLSTTGTPTVIFQVRASQTQGTGILTGTSLGVSQSAGITTINNSSNQWWELRLDIACYTPGQGSGNTTLSGAGYVTSPGGFASPYTYALEPTAPATATWTMTYQAEIMYFLEPIHDVEFLVKFQHDYL